MPPIWEREGISREEYGRKNLTLAFDVYFNDDDKEHHGDIRYDDLQRLHGHVLASEGGRWRDAVPLEPLHVGELYRDATYRIGQLPLGSTFRMPDGTERTLLNYTYMPRPSKGAIIETNLSDIDNGWISNKGVFTEFGNTPVTFISHPHKKIKPSKSAAQLRSRGTSSSKLKIPEWMRNSIEKAAVRTPSKSSLYKKKASSRKRRVLSAKRSRRRKLGTRAKSVSVDKLKRTKSSTRKKSA